jgi:hypothetical protein
MIRPQHGTASNIRQPRTRFRQRAAQIEVIGTLGIGSVRETV